MNPKLAPQLDMFGKVVAGVPDHLRQPWMEECDFVLVSTLEEVKQMVDGAIKAGLCALDLETEGLDNRTYDGKMNHQIAGFAVSYQQDKEIGYYLPINHKVEDGNLPVEETLQEIKRLCENTKLVFHNAKFDAEFLEGWISGLNLDDAERFDDTMVEYYLMDSNHNLAGSLGLKKISENFLGRKMIDIQDLFPKGTKHINFCELHPQEGYIYASSDAINTLKLHLTIKDHHLLIKQAGIYKLEKRVIAAVRWMEQNRIHINKQYLAQLTEEIKIKMKEIEDEIYQLCGRKFNLDSPKELGNILFEELKIPNAGKTAKSGQYKTSKDDLDELNEEHNGKFPALSLVVKYRKYTKALGTYIEPLSTRTDKFNDALFQFFSCGTNTGRFASRGSENGPDCGVQGQNITSVEKGIVNIRRAFAARPGFILAAIDYSGVELRLIANFAGIKKWIEEFINGSGDLHSITARDCFGLAPDQPVPPELRKIAKAVNFGCAYGAGGQTIAESAGISKEEGFRIHRAFFNGVPEFDRWIKKKQKEGKEQGFVTTAWGRIRLLPDIKNDNPFYRGHDERNAVNSPIQGSSADITKIAMVKVYDLVKKSNWWDDVRLMLTVHDELVFEVRDSCKEELLPILIDTMCNVAPKIWPVPIKVDCEVGPDWGTLQVFCQKCHTIYGAKECPTCSGKPVTKEEKKEVKAPQSPLPNLPATETNSVTNGVTNGAHEEEVGQSAPIEAVSTVTFVVTEPLNKWKWRRLEALFILADAKAYQTKRAKLCLIDERSNDLLGNRKIFVHPDAFYFKALEMGVVKSPA